jgi:hypothetical protein
MTKRFLVSLFILFSTFSSFRLFASPQVPDYIIFKGDTIATYNLILEQYLQRQEQTPSEKLFGLSFRNSSNQGFSFNCWRGYQAIYKIDNDSLFLVNIISCGERKSAKIDAAASAEKVKALFGDKVLNDRVYIKWFSSDISFPLTNKVLRWDGIFYTIFEKERVVHIWEGKVLTVEDVENYVDDPKRIDRKDKNKVSDIFFKRLKKLKWKNKEEYDCSEKYLVTIDENGNVSKVGMLYTEAEMDKYYERDEYNYCIDKIFNSLKGLKFDVVKDKGKPIAEDIYIEIWIEDNGKIENWTH